jgi:hypothetical protein
MYSEPNLYFLCKRYVVEGSRHFFMISLGTPPATHFPIARSAVWGLRININKGSKIPQILPLRNGKTLSNYFPSDLLHQCISRRTQENRHTGSMKDKMRSTTCVLGRGGRGRGHLGACGRGVDPHRLNMSLQD